MSWISSKKSASPNYLRLFLLALFGLTIIGASFAVSAKMQKLKYKEMSDVSAQEGVAFTLKNFEIDGSQTLQFFEGPNSCCNGGLRLQDLHLNEPGGNSSQGVTTGTLGDPISLDVGGSNNGVVVLELPENKSNMERNTILIGGPTDATATNGIWFTDSGDGAFKNLGGLRIEDAQYAGGTRLSIGGTSEGAGGIRMGLAIQLNGDLDFNDPTGGGFALNGLHGSANYTDGDDINFGDGDFSGPLRWASIPAARPIIINFGARSGDGELNIEFNPDENAPQAGTLAVENAFFQGTSFGEIVLEDIKIRNVEIRHNDTIDPVTHDLSGYNNPRNF